MDDKQWHGDVPLFVKEALVTDAIYEINPRGVVTTIQLSRATLTNI